MTTPTEAQIQAAVQTTIRSIAAFASADVVINDWKVLDQSKGNAPYVVIENADNFTSRQDTRTVGFTWEVPIRLFESFTEWKASLDNFSTRRQAILDEFNEIGSNRSPGADGTLIVTVDEIRNDGPITEWYDRYIPPEMLSSAMPDYITQRIIIDVRVF